MIRSKNLQDQMEAHPLWRLCYPKSYHNIPGGYWSPKTVAWQLFAIPEKSRWVDNPGIVLQACWGSKMVEKRVPMYWVSRQLAEAARQTIPPTTFDWRTAKLPFEAMAIMLPKGVIEEPEYGVSAGFVSYFRLQDNSVLTDYATGESVSVPDGKGRFAVAVGVEPVGSLLIWDPSGLGPIDLRQIDKEVFDGAHLTAIPSLPTEVKQEIEREGLLSGLIDPETEEEKRQKEPPPEVVHRFLMNGVHMLFSVLMIMLRKPDLVTRGEAGKRLPGKAGTGAKEFWSPNMLGKDYRIRTSVQAEGQGGHHASPRPHWVRGHWRDQACGPRHSERMEIWIEPYFKAIKEN